MRFLILTGGLFCAVAVLAQIASIVTVIRRFRRRNVGVIPDKPGVSILRPVCGIENFVEETLRASFQLDHPQYELLFCVADADDPAVPIVRRLIAEHPQVAAQLLIGNERVNSNPKLNNLIKGWHAARYDWVLMADSNVLMPRNQVQRMFAAWRSDTGLVCSPPVGGAAQNIWAELECAFLNSHQARWQCFADSIGLGFAQGKSMLWRRALLEDAGGIEALASEIAEDAAATKIVRARGLRVRLAAVPFIQPLGRRQLTDVWHRQVRWARLRRETFKWFFLPEILVGAVPPLALAGLTAYAAGWPILATIVPLLTGWYAAEAWLVYRAGWQLSLRSPVVFMLRDALLPALWVAAWIGDDFEWRGNAMSVALDLAGEPAAE